MADDRSRIPKLTALPAADELRRLPLTPIDGFVLSRVDGASSEEDIVGVTGLPPEQIRESLDRLAALSLINLGESAPARTVSGVASRGAPPSGPIPAATPAPPSPTAQVGSVKGDLSDDERARILELAARVDDLDHYAALGAKRGADKKEIKRAYFERAALYHPDRYFRRNVGDLKPKLEAIFARMTLAHDVLTDKARRAEYDAYLEQVATTRDLETRMREGEEKIREAQVEAQMPPPASDPTPPRTTSRPDMAAVGESAEPRTISRPNIPIDAQARRDLLAKHLRGGRSFTPSKVPAAAPAQGSTTSSDPEALRRHYEQKKTDVARAQAMKHKVVGDQARAAGDPIAAASSYKAALSFLPDDAELRALYAEATAVSDSALAETYRNQATYEEKNGRWADAAKSWSKLAALLPSDAFVQERAGNAILLAKGNLHDAAAFATRAVTLSPQNADYRKLLATVYLEAGLLKNARREIDAAAQLAPHDDSIAALARRLANATGR